MFRNGFLSSTNFDKKYRELQELSLGLGVKWVSGNCYAFSGDLQHGKECSETWAPAASFSLGRACLEDISEYPSSGNVSETDITS